MAAKKLTAKQQAFCEEYLVDLNATQAAIRAGYKTDSAGPIGSENLTKRNIQAEIARLQSERSKRVELTADAVLAEIAEIGLKARDAGQYATALRAAELKGRHLGMFPNKHELTGKDGGPVRISSTERMFGNLSDEELDERLKAAEAGKAT